jgi:hypothetical protein
MRHHYLFTLLIMLSMNLYGSAQQKVNGIIYQDTNQNGRKDPGEIGIKNVAVSNGIEVVLSDSEGRYEIEINREGVVFVIKPEGYRYPVNETQIPQFFYVHRPDGSPDDFRYRGFSPTGLLPESLDFPLIAMDNASDDFKVLVFGDPQPYTQQELEWFDKGIVADVSNKDGVAFGVSVGDIVGDDLSLFPVIVL